MSADLGQSATAYPPRVMIVDDSEAIREIVEELFSTEGYEVASADGADACLQFLKNGFRGVVLMDVMMPCRNGWDTIRDIEQAGLLEGNVFVMLTGMDAPDERMDGLQEFIVDYLTKPFDPQELVDTVHKYHDFLQHRCGARG